MTSSDILTALRKRQNMELLKSQIGETLSVNETVTAELQTANATIQRLHRSLETSSMTGAICQAALKKLMQETGHEAVTVPVNALPDEYQNFDVETITLKLAGHPSDIEARIKLIIVDQLGFDPTTITNDKQFVADLGADSLDEIELAMAIEDEFEIEIPDDDAEKLTTVQSVIDYVQRAVLTKPTYLEITE